MKILISLPTYNERENLEKLVTSILNLNIPLDILIIDDQSPDGTGEIADDLAKRDSRIKVIHRPRKSGLGSAILAGFKYAIENGYDWIMNMDVDFSHDPQDIPKFMDHLSNNDLIVGSRHVPGGKVVGWNWKRHMLHWLASCYTDLVLGRYVSDHTNSFKMYRVDVLKNLPLEEVMLKMGPGYVGHTLLIYLFHKGGYKIGEVPVTFVDRQEGQSKMSTKDMIEGLWAILKMRCKSPTSFLEV